MACKVSGMAIFTYQRVIRFHETDAAGVVYFATLLSLCHEAYEAAIAAHSALIPKQFFSGAAETAVPIVHTAADFYQPLFCGDSVSIAVVPKQLSPHSFEIAYVVSKNIVSKDAVAKGDANKGDPTSDRAKQAVKAFTRHVCIETATRRRAALPAELVRWIEMLAE